tara:strand:+ start:174 stop:470 length:297 start_codon:yes stop_codon:yes gene_type:complete
MDNYTKDEIVNELIAGIVELTYIDSFSVEHKMSATLSPNHLDGDKESTHSPNIVRVWNMIGEMWEDISISSIIDFERLTGFGIKDERDLVDFENISFA